MLDAETWKSRILVPSEVIKRRGFSPTHSENQILQLQTRLFNGKNFWKISFSIHICKPYEK